MPSRFHRKSLNGGLEPTSDAIQRRGFLAGASVESQQGSSQRSHQHLDTGLTVERQDGPNLNRPLDSSLKEIRLLVLNYFEGNNTEPIVCNIIQTTLDRAPPYEALSYVCLIQVFEDLQDLAPSYKFRLSFISTNLLRSNRRGDSSDTVPLCIGCHTLHITRNLDIALRNLRRPSVIDKGPATSSHRRIWIDAICINQDDIQERNEQVRIMFSIYSMAARVLIWLGEERDGSNSAMDLVLKIHATKLASYQRQFPDLVLNTYEQSQVNRYAVEEPWYISLGRLQWAAGGELSNSENSNEWLAFQCLMERPWWRRMWVVQELAAAGDRAILGCGSKWIPWEPFVMASLMMGSWKQHPFLQRMRRLAFGIDIIGNLAAICIRTGGPSNGFALMANLLFYTKSKQATLPVDRVFALLGFTPSIPMLPDYEKTPEEVYKSFVRLFINSTRLLTILSFNRFPKKLDLPSWTPDFSCGYSDDEYNTAIPRGYFGADAHSGHDDMEPLHACGLNPSDGDSELTVTGWEYDRPIYVSKPWQGSLEERDSSLFGLLKDYEKALQVLDEPRFLEHCSQDTSEARKEARWEALWRTLIWNATPESRYPAPDAYGDLYRDITNSEHTLKAGNHDISQYQRIISPIGPSMEYYDSLVKHSFNRRFFITSKGDLGSGPVEMREDDLVCILNGFKTPVVLRKKDGNCFEWVGPAYVHGIMHGESLMRITLDDIGTFKLI